MSNRVVFDPSWPGGGKPAYEDYFDQYLLGLVGKPTLNLQKVCMDQKPRAFQYFKSAEDVALTALTVGIYSPVTVRVWCGD
jgi:hypothetical protein